MWRSGSLNRKRQDSEVKSVGGAADECLGSTSRSVGAQEGWWRPMINWQKAYRGHRKEGVPQAGTCYRVWLALGATE